MTDLVVARLLQNPLGQEAPQGEKGDMVRVSDGRTTVYLSPNEFERTSEDDLRAMLAAAHREAKAAREAEAAHEAAAAASRREIPQALKVSTGVIAAGVSARRDSSSRQPSLTAPRRAGRPAERLW